MQKSFISDKSKLYIVSTPIGNLADMTYRAVEILQSVDLIFAEDTRNSRVLLKHYHIDKPLISYHEFNKFEQEKTILDFLENGKNIALISDAGTPGISDPGYEIICKAIEHHFDVIAIPGASAILTALVSSGLVVQPFTFIGFLPRKKGEITEKLNHYQKYPETLIFYESPLRVKKTIEMIFSVFGNRRVVFARELTKKFETITRATLEEAIGMDLDTRGEYVILIEGFTKEAEVDLSITDHVKRFMKDGLDEKDAMKRVAKERKMTKSDIYRVYKIGR